MMAGYESGKSMSKAFVVVREREVFMGTGFQPYFYFYVLSLISRGR